MTRQYSADSFHMKKILRGSYRDWIENIIASSPSSWCAVSLTLKQGRLSYGSLEMLNAIKCEEAIGDFLHYFNDRIYRGAYRRKKKMRLGCVPVIEKGWNGAFHLHLLLEIPEYMADNPHAFSDLLKQIWKKSRWARHQMDVQFCNDVPGGAAGWADYITKTYVMNDESICLTHMNLPKIKD